MEFLRNKITDGVTKSCDDKIVKQEAVKEIMTPLKKRIWNTKETEKSIIKKQHYKISKLLNDSTVSKFVTKKRVRVNDLWSSQHSANKNVRFKASMLRSDLADYSDVYIFYKRGNISFRCCWKGKW